MVLNRLQLTADQPTSQYLNIRIRRLPLVQWQTTEQKVRHLTQNTLLYTSYQFTITTDNYHNGNLNTKVSYCNRSCAI